MSVNRQTAERFFHDCERGKGWEACRAHCHEDATFSCQAEALAEIQTVADYTGWMQGLHAMLPDYRYEVKSFAVDEERGNVCVYAVGRGTHTGEGGPVPPTGKSADVDYAYVMDFDDGRIRRMTKIWNGGYTAKRMGWV